MDSPEASQVAVLPQVRAIPLTPWRRPVAILAGAAVAMTALFWPNILQLFHTWKSASFSHCWLIVPIAVYLIWMERDKLRRVRCKPSFLAIAFMPLVAAVWLAGYLGDVQMVQQYAMVAMFILIAWAILGTAAVKVMRFPLIFLFTAVPVGESLIPPLQDFAASTAVMLLRWTRIPVLLEGHYISVPNGNWEVAAACSGIRYLISSIVIGLVFSHVAFRSWKRRVVFMILSGAVPIVANALRVYGIVLLGYLTDNRLAAGVDHLIYGWIFFTIITIALLSIGFHWQEQPLVPPPLPPGHPPRMPAPPLGRTAWAAAAGILLAALPLVAGHALNARLADPGELASAPTVSSPWSKMVAGDDYWIDSSFEPPARMSQSYENSEDKARVRMLMAFYPLKADGIDLFHFGPALLSTQAVEIMHVGHVEITVDGKPLRVKEILARSSSGGQVIWMWMSSGGELTSNTYQVKLLQARARLLGHPSESALIAISSDFVYRPIEARHELQNFLDHTPAGAFISSVH